MIVIFWIKLLIIFGNWFMGLCIIMMVIIKFLLKRRLNVLNFFRLVNVRSKICIERNWFGCVMVLRFVLLSKRGGLIVLMSLRIFWVRWKWMRILLLIWVYNGLGRMLLN